MNRRDALGMFCALAAASPRGFGQPQPAARIRRVVILLGGSAESSAANRAALAGALGARGWKEGGNLTLDARFSDGRAADQPKLAAELAQSKPDVVVSQGEALPVTFQSRSRQSTLWRSTLRPPGRLGFRSRRRYCCAPTGWLNREKGTGDADAHQSRARG